MSVPDDVARLAEFRSLRDDAWAVLKLDVERIRADLDARGVGERIKDKVTDEAHDAWETTLEVASEHRGIVGATVVALLAWLLRGPIGDAVAALFQNDDDEADSSEHHPVQSVE